MFGYVTDQQKDHMCGAVMAGGTPMLEKTLTAETVHAVLLDMIQADRGDARRIHHFLKVYALAGAIAAAEHMEEQARLTLELAAILHDVGIHASEAKYSSAAGRYQELEGPPLARKMLERYELPEPIVERVCTLIGRHHTYTDVDGLDCRILLEADFLVNMEEEQMKPAQIASARQVVFQTETGLKLLEDMFPGEVVKES